MHIFPNINANELDDDEWAMKFHEAEWLMELNSKLIANEIAKMFPKKQ